MQFPIKVDEAIAAAVFGRKSARQPPARQAPFVLKDRTALAAALCKHGHPPQRSDFDIVSYLGEGSVGAVVKASHRPSGKEFAIKAVKKKRVLEQDLGRQLLDEAKAQHGVVHENLLQNFTWFEDDDGNLFLVYEFASGGNLFRFIHNGPLSEENAARVFAQVVNGIRHLHKLGKVHHNIKPENILLDEDMDGNFIVKVADFGWCAEEGGRKTFCSTPAILAPETIQGEDSGQGVDVWALGVLLFQMLTGFTPFDSAGSIEDTCSNIVLQDLDRSLVDAVPQGAHSLLKGLLDKDPSQRMALEDVLSHPWIVEHCGGQVASSTKQPMALPDAPGKRPIALPDVRRLLPLLDAPISLPVPDAPIPLPNKSGLLVPGSSQVGGAPGSSPIGPPTSVPRASPQQASPQRALPSPNPIVRSMPDLTAASRISPKQGVLMSLGASMQNIACIPSTSHGFPTAAPPTPAHSDRGLATGHQQPQPMAPTPVHSDRSLATGHQEQQPMAPTTASSNRSLVTGYQQQQQQPMATTTASSNRSLATGYQQQPPLSASQLPPTTVINHSSLPSNVAAVPPTSFLGSVPPTLPFGHPSASLPPTIDGIPPEHSAPRPPSSMLRIIGGAAAGYLGSRSEVEPGNAHPAKQSSNSLVLEQLLGLGFQKDQSLEALKHASHVEGAVEWLAAQQSCNSPAVEEPGRGSTSAEESQGSLAQQLVALGFPESQVAEAVKRHSSAEAAVDWMVANMA